MDCKPKLVEVAVLGPEFAKQAIECLETALANARKDPPRELLMLIISKDHEVDWHWTGTEDTARLIGLVTIMQQRMLDRAKGE